MYLFKLFDRQRDRGSQKVRKRKTADFPFFGSLPKRPQVLELGLTAGFPSGWQGPSHVKHNLLLPRVSISNKLESEWS